MKNPAGQPICVDCGGPNPGRFGTCAACKQRTTEALNQRMAAAIDRLWPAIFDALWSA